MTRQSSPEAVVGAFEGDPGRPDVWVFDRRSPEFAQLAERGPLGDEDRARSRALREPAAQVDLLARRAASRRVLALYLRRPADSVRIVTLPGGKPVFKPLPDDAWRLSYSSGHSGDLFCLAVGTASSLGVDVERERAVPRAQGIATRWFTSEEASSLGAAPVGRSSEEFLRLWTAKEALAKRHAAGLRLMSRGSDALDVRAEAARERVVHFVPHEGYIGCLASLSPIAEVRLVSEPSRLP